MDLILLAWEGDECQSDHNFVGDYQLVSLLQIIFGTSVITFVNSHKNRLQRLAYINLRSFKLHQ